MILRTRYAHDLETPAKLGDEDLVPPDADALAELVAEYLLVSNHDDAVTGAAIDHVRYKPGVAVQVTYTVSLASGVTRLVTYKAHAAGKSPSVRTESKYADSYAALAAPLAVAAELDGHGRSLRTFPADPDLRGLVRVMEARRTARWVDRCGDVEPMVVRLRASSIDLVRYKLGRRAVFRMTAKLRGDDPPRAVREFGIRVHPPKVLAGIAARRAALDTVAEVAAWPRMLDSDERTGALLEPWIDGVAGARDDFTEAHAREAMGALQVLHHTPLPADLFERGAVRSSVDDPATRDALSRLVGTKSDLDVVTVEAPATAWVHGDLHPDQCLVSADGPRLVDLDDLRPGAREEDLATWIADALTIGDAASFADAAHAPLREYESASGAPVDEPRLLNLVALEVEARALAQLRRLEVSVVTRGESFVALARRLREGSA